MPDRLYELLLLWTNCCNLQLILFSLFCKLKTCKLVQILFATILQPFQRKFSGLRRITQILHTHPCREWNPYVQLPKICFPYDYPMVCKPMAWTGKDSNSKRNSPTTSRMSNAFNPTTCKIKAFENLFKIQ